MESGAFIEKWLGITGGAERANYQLFLTEFAQMLGVPTADPGQQGALGQYQFDAPIPGGSFRSLKASGFADLYKEGCFILEAKQSYLKESESEPARPDGGSYDRLMRSAFAQAKHYAANIPGERPSPPFLIVCDIGRSFELYFDWTGNEIGRAHV